jgi:hypothetical protein
VDFDSMIARLPIEKLPSLNKYRNVVVANINSIIVSKGSLAINNNTYIINER